MTLDDIPRFSPSQLEVWMECPQQWEYYYRELLKRKGPAKKYFDFGNYFHELSHVYYQLLQSGRKAGDSFTLDYMVNRVKRDVQNASKTPDLLQHIGTMNDVLNTLKRFIMIQSPVIDAGITVLDIERHVEVKFTTPKGREVILHGFIDLVYRDRTGKLRIRDHKTGAKKNSWNSRRVQLLSQLLIYDIAYELATGYRVHIVEISFINSHQYSERTKPSREDLFGLYPQEHNDAALSNFYQHILKIIDKILDGDSHRRYNADCGNCQFFDLCTLELRGHRTDGVINTYYEKVTRNHEDSRFSKLITGEGSITEENSSGNEASKKGDPPFLRWNGA